MSLSRSLWRTLKSSVLLAATWASLLGTGWAQAPGKTGGEASGSGGASVYVFPYAVVGFAIVLGILSIVLSSKRRDKPRQDAK